MGAVLLAMSLLTTLKLPQEVGIEQETSRNSRVTGTKGTRHVTIHRGARSGATEGRGSPPAGLRILANGRHLGYAMEHLWGKLGLEEMHS